MIELTVWVETRDLRSLSKWLSESTILVIAEELSRIEAEHKAMPFRLLERDRAIAVFEQLDPIHQQQVLEGLRDDRFNQIVEDMDPDDRARLVGELPAKVANRVLSGLSPQERAMTAALLGYPEESAGRMMTPQFVNLRESMTAAEALDKVRRIGSSAETVYTLPVTDGQRHLKGVVALDELVLARPEVTVGELMSSEIHAVRVDDDQEHAARLIQEAGLLALPVLDSEDRLVGVITVDDAMHIIEAEHSEDMAFHGASLPLGRPYLAASTLGLAKSRATWLMLLIVAATLTVNVLQVFEDTMSQVVTLALFIPLLSGTGGNAGAQASTVVIRAMAVGELRFGDLPRVVWRESRVGVILGAMLAAASYVPVTVFFDTDIALIVSITLITVCTWATLVGSILPLLAKRFGVDPAVMSAPVITTLVDASGLVIYFLVAKAVLGL